MSLTYSGSSGYGTFDVHSFVHTQLVQFHNAETGISIAADM